MELFVYYCQPNSNCKSSLLDRPFSASWAVLSAAVLGRGSKSARTTRGLSDFPPDISKEPANKDSALDGK